MVNVKRAILLAILAYVVSFATGILTAMALGVDLSTAEETPTSVWVVGTFATVIITAIFANWYFKEQGTVPSSKEGLHFGFVLFIVAFAMDLALIIPYIMTSDSSASVISYYTNPFFWIIVLLMFVTCMYVGYSKEQKSGSVRATGMVAPKKPAVKRAVKKSSSAKSTKKAPAKKSSRKASTAKKKKKKGKGRARK